MKTPSPLALLALCSLVVLPLMRHEVAAQAIAIDARVDPRVELVSIIFRLAGNPEYNTGQIEAYNDAINAYFGPFKAHPAIEFARRLREEKGMRYSRCMHMAVFLKDEFPVQPRADLEKSWPFLWRRDDARAFIEHAQAFVEDTHFETFLEQQKPLYDLTESRAQALLDEVDLTWFETFFGERPRASFKLVLGLVNGTSNYGPSFRNPDGPEELYSILGVQFTDDEGLPRFYKGEVVTIIHEFNHSFVNPVTVPLFSAMGEAGKTIQAAVAPQMRQQGYSMWPIMINESLVRAAVVRYLAANRGPEAAAHEIAQQKKRYFVWMDELSALLGQYEANRDTYPTFASFLPTIATFYNDLAPRIDDLVEQFEKEQAGEEQ